MLLSNTPGGLFLPIPSTLIISEHLFNSAGKANKDPSGSTPITFVLGEFFLKN